MATGLSASGLLLASMAYPTATESRPATARVFMCLAAGQGQSRDPPARDIWQQSPCSTVIALTASDKLGIPLDSRSTPSKLGDSDLPPAPVAGGSNTTASVCNVVAKACEQIRSRIAQAAVGAKDGKFAGNDPGKLVLAEGQLKNADGTGEPLETALTRISNGAVEAYAEGAFRMACAARRCRRSFTRGTRCWPAAPS